MNNLMRSEWLEQLPDYLAEIMQQMSLEATAIIAARINYIGKVKKSDIHKLTNALAYAGADINEIERIIARFTKKSDAEIERILTEVAAEDDSFAKMYYEAKGLVPKTYITDAYLQTALTSVIKQTQEAIRNMSNTTSLFYQMPDGTYSDIRSTYIRVIDQAIYEVQSGSIDYHTAMKRAMLSLGKGTRCIEYMSGYHRRLDSAVRQNILDGTKQLNQTVMDYHGKAFGANGVELTAHAISAPDHVNVQGHRFTNKEFEKMQSGMDCKDIQGKKYKGFPRKITEWNCKHFAIPVIVDIGSPAYTDEQLEELKKSSTAKYDDTQKARAMETRLRTLKEQKNALLESGDEAGAKQIQKKITAQQRVYRDFCKQKGIHRDYVRENVPKFNGKVTRQKSGVIEPSVNYIGEIRHISEIENRFGNLNSKRVIFTNERIKHVKANHPKDYEMIIKFAPKAVLSPDHILIELERKETLEFIKKIDERHYIISHVRLSIGEAMKNKDNSIISSYIIRKRSLKSLMKKHPSLLTNEVDV